MVCSSATLPVRGAIDNGSRGQGLRAAGAHEVSDSAHYEVSTPKPGTMAWFKAGPARQPHEPRGPHRGRRRARGGPGRDQQGQAAGPAQALGPHGAELWSVTLDTREGEVADLAVLPDGRVWVAMNVRKPGDPSPQPRIALFDAAGKFAGVEALGDFGQGRPRHRGRRGRRLLRGRASHPPGRTSTSPTGGSPPRACRRWAKPGTTCPTPSRKPHTFSEFAMDVVIKGDVAWVIGASNGNA
jgi:hypothetical protein